MKSRILYCLLLSSFLIGGPVWAQSLSAPPLVSSLDDAGVDVISGNPTFKLQDLSIGNGVSSLSHTISNGGLQYFWGFNDDYEVFVASGGLAGEGRIAILGHSSQLFDKSLLGAGYVAHNGDGSTLTLEKTSINVNGTDTYTYTYIKRDGTKMTYRYLVKTGTELIASGDAFRQVVYPNGYEVTVVYSADRKQSVLTNTGLQLKYINDPSGTNAGPSASKIVAVNNAIEYCNPAASSCSFAEEWPTVTYDWPRYADVYWPPNSNLVTTGPTAIKAYFKVTDAMGRITVYTYSPHAVQYGNGTYYSPRIVAVKNWEAAGTTANATFSPATTTYAYKNYERGYSDSAGAWIIQMLKTGAVSEVNKGGAKWTYNYTQPDTQFVTVGSSLGPKGLHSTLMAYDGDVNLTPVGVSSFLTEVATSDGVTVVYNANKENRPKTAIVRGKKFIYEYDSRGNITKETQTGVAVLPAGSDPKVTTAIYQPCTPINFRWCNKATALIDAKSNQTDYVYGDEHGQIKSVTLPADEAGVRAQTRYKYSPLYAWFKDATGAFVRAGSPVWMLTEENSCSQGAASGETCADPSKLVTTRYYYGPDAGPNNLWLRGVEKEAGGKILRTCYQNDIYGHVIAETAPKAGLTSCP